MKKWNLIIDVDKCNNCNNCVMAVKDEYVGNDFAGYSAAMPTDGHEWLSIDRHIRGNGSMVDVTYIPRMCNHCDDAPCVKAGAGAVTKRKDGIVIIDPVKARGRKDLVSACPYGAVSWNEDLQLPQHWTFDAHLLDSGWTQPRCVQVCATGAMTVARVSDQDMDSLVKELSLTAPGPELGTRPRVHYRSLEKAETGFIGGNVCARTPAGLLENIEGATVELQLAKDAASQRTTTDAYGDFKIDGIDAKDAPYTIRLHHAAHGVATISGTYVTSFNHGTIELAPDCERAE